MEKRETFSSRLGFLLISAGCAIGLGNVWRFPYIVGQYGGGAFVLIYLAFLVLLGLPVMAIYENGQMIDSVVKDDATAESIEDACMAHGVDADRLVDALNEFLAKADK